MFGKSNADPGLWLWATLSHSGWYHCSLLPPMDSGLWDWLLGLVIMQHKHYLTATLRLSDPWDADPFLASRYLL